MSRPGLVALLVAISALVAVRPATADDTGARALAVRRTSTIAIDGRLDEPAWTAAPVQTGFTQRFPTDGAPASHPTRFAILYDDAAIYVGIWADDAHPSEVRRLLTRRDLDSTADIVSVAIDSYYDRRTAYMFQVNAAGVQRDQILFDDTSSDDSWDAVWTSDVAMTATGWTAELRIPLSQLRFPHVPAQHWGIQIVRKIGRTQEEDSWSRWPRTSDQVVSKFGVVDGIHGIPPSRRLELLPYASGGIQVKPVAAGDPLNDHVSPRGNIGLDVKYGLGSAFTLSATINPDFGQVEADPSQVNLSANELFFAERRPFFLEGTDLFRLPIAVTNGGQEQQFYSRRIGEAPSVEPADYAYVNSPTATTIYGAGKLTGKSRGWSVGVLDAVTGEETATTVAADGMRGQLVVSPLTNYAVGRLKHDFREGHTTVGASATAVDRSLTDTGLDALVHDQAYTAGTQLVHTWGGKHEWGAELTSVGSYVHGTKAAIARTQTLQRHLYQRPDSYTHHFDPDRTSLTGGGLQWKLGRYGDTKHWRFMFAGDARTIGLELNDAGFQRRSDDVLPFVYGEYHDEVPGDAVNAWSVNSDVFVIADELGSSPRYKDVGWELNGSVQLKNLWAIHYGGNAESTKWDTGALRGGPSLHGDSGANVFAAITTDSTKRVAVELDYSGFRDWTKDGIATSVNAGVVIQARPNIDVTVSPGVASSSDPMQYVAETQDTSGRTHFVFARIRQFTTSLTVRLNWTFSPHLSLQAYAQPFLSAGAYSEYKDIDNPRAHDYHARFTPLGGPTFGLADGTYTASSDTGTYQFRRPDFNFRQLRSTVVLRWEFRPGSNLYAIWSQGRTGASDEGRFHFGSDTRGLFSADSESIVMLKANYWIGL